MQIYNNYKFLFEYHNEHILPVLDDLSEEQQALILGVINMCRHTIETLTPFI